MEDHLDRIDRNIIAALSLDGRLSMSALAARVGLSKTPVQARLRRLEPKPPAVMPSVGGSNRPQVGRRLCLWPLSRHTARLLPKEGLLINSFPFRLGRPEEAHENPPPSLNDLWLLDKVPFLVSRNHLTVLLVDGARYVVQDRGSHLGTIVNERKIGGNSPFKEVELEDGDNVIILGHASSPFKFRAAVENAPA